MAGPPAPGVPGCLSLSAMAVHHGSAAHHGPAAAAGSRRGRWARRLKAGPGVVHGPGWPLAGGIVAGAVLDAAFGDPRRGHPVAMFGRAAQAVADRVYADSVARGAGYTACCVAAAGGLGLAAQRLTRRRPLAGLAVTAAAAWTVTGAASLAAEAQRIQRALKAGDLPAARAALPSLCGRDPAGLDEFQIARAVIESVAENASDAVVAPLLWGAAAGCPASWPTGRSTPWTR